VTTSWTPSSWRDHPAAQQPRWPDEAALDASLKTLGGMPPLVFAGEARKLTESLGQVAEGNALQTKHNSTHSIQRKRRPNKQG